MNKHSGKSELEHKIFTADTSLPIPNETDEQAYQRIWRKISAAIDNEGTDNISSIIDEMTYTASSDIVFNAYIAACLRKKSLINGKEFDIRLLMFPLIAHSAGESAVPSFVDMKTAGKIQEIITNSLDTLGRTSDIIIPTSRLLSVEQFEGENPQDLYEMLTGVASILANDGNRHSRRYVVLSEGLESEDRDELSFTHQNVNVAARIYPVILVTPSLESVNEPEIKMESLLRISDLLSLCGEDANTDNCMDQDARQIMLQIGLMPLTTPFIAEARLRSGIQYERLLANIQSIVDAATPCVSHACVCYSSSESLLRIIVTITLEGNEKREVELEMDLPNSYESYLYAERINQALVVLGLDKVELIFDDQTTGSTLYSGELH